MRSSAAASSIRHAGSIALAVTITSTSENNAWNALVSFARNYEDKPERVHVVALKGAGHWAAAAKAFRELIDEGAR